jgi:hypothetical protein
LIYLSDITMAAGVVKAVVNAEDEDEKAGHKRTSVADGRADKKAKGEGHGQGKPRSGKSRQQRDETRPQSKKRQQGRGHNHKK